MNRQQCLAIEKPTTKNARWAGSLDAHHGYHGVLKIPTTNGETSWQLHQLGRSDDDDSKKKPSRKTDMAIENQNFQ